MQKDMSAMISSKLDPLGSTSRQDFPSPSRQNKPHQGFPLNLPKSSFLLVAWDCMLVTVMLAHVVWDVNYLSAIFRMHLIVITSQLNGIFICCLDVHPSFQTSNIATKTLHLYPQTNSLLAQWCILWDPIRVIISKGINDLLRPRLQNDIPPRSRCLGNTDIVKVSWFCCLHNPQDYNVPSSTALCSS